MEQLIKLGPAAGSTLALWLTMHYLRSPLALPGVLLCIPLLFHAVLLGAGWSLADAADAGWVMQGEVRLPARIFQQQSCSLEMRNLCDCPAMSSWLFTDEFRKIGAFVRQAMSCLRRRGPGLVCHLPLIVRVGCRLASRDVHHVEKITQLRALCGAGGQTAQSMEAPQQQADPPRTMQEGVNFWDLYALFNIHDWRLSTIDKLSLLRQTPKLLALFFVVAFGSSLDVAAIQAGLSDPLDFNHELKTVGARLPTTHAALLCVTL